VASSETNDALRWHDPVWLASVVEWIDARVERAGAVDQVHAYPWATAIRVPTSSGNVWFKACIEQLAHEVSTLELIGARRPNDVPRLRASDRANGWMLMEDAGERLRELESRPGQIERWEEAVATYAQLQLDVAADADRFVLAGVPDRRGTVAQELAALLDSSTFEAAARLRPLVPRLAAEEAALDALGLPYTIQHDDLHDANVFVADGGYRIIDWGDAAVTNPLLSLAIAVAVVAWRFEVEPTAPEVRRVRDAYLEPFTAHVARRELVGLVETVVRVGYACGILKWAEVVAAIPPETRGPYEDAIPERVERLLELCA
jgi:aminoglycoside phosphotransferase (APT) family kinase protein